MDRFSIAIGYHVYSMMWNDGGLTRRDRDGHPATENLDSRKRRSIQQQLHAMKFSPGIGDIYAGWKMPFRRNDSMGEAGYETVRDRGDNYEAFEVYFRLVEKYEGTAAAMLEAYDLQQQGWLTDRSDITIQQAIQLIESDRLGITIAGGPGEPGVNKVRYDHDLICRDDVPDIDSADFMPWIYQARQFCLKFRLVLNVLDGYVEAYNKKGEFEQRWKIDVKKNCLHHMACPSCGNKSEFHIETTSWVQVEDEGTGDLVDGPQWTDSSECFCTNCKQYGQVGDFCLDADLGKQLR